MGQITSKIHLVEKVSDVDKLKLDQSTKVACVTQTTLSVDDTKLIIRAIKEKFFVQRKYSIT